MPNQKFAQGFGFVQTVKKFVVSAFVVSTFVAYTIHDRLNGTDRASASAPSSSSDTNQATLVPSPTYALSSTDVSAFATAVAAVASASSPTPAQAATTRIASPTVVPPIVVAGNGYRDGQYTGNVADAFFGDVQVKATIQGGRISDVQFLQYPSDRRTSVRINSYAVPALRNEAIRAQKAEVDIISGATLTSEAFIQSLQSALNKAKA
jgi:uncharacterized protein with FMN-binding domain